MEIRLDIFKKQNDGSLQWVEAAGNLELAKTRVRTLQELTNGDYIVFDQDTQETLTMKNAGRADTCKTES